MDVVPDFSPWLVPLNLSEYDKEERRVIFYYSLKVVQIAASQRSQLSLDSSNMQPQPAFNPRFSHSQHMPAKHSTFNQTVICHLSAILDLIQLAKAHYQNAPLNALEIIIPSTWSALAQRLTMQQNTLRHLTVSVSDNNLAPIVSAISSTIPKHLATNIADTSNSSPKMHCKRPNHCNPQQRTHPYGSHTLWEHSLDAVMGSKGALKELEEMMSSPPLPPAEMEGFGYSAPPPPPRANMVTPLVKCVTAMVEEMHRLELQAGPHAAPAASMDVLMGDVVVGMAVVSLEEADGEGQPDCLSSILGVF
ncbi:hypothetical protein HDU77_001573 [Chytriomyces hyalinus]|nr:hypothetical protein HDU77_001573 [Chytriomyces hyalinus]